MPAQRKAISLRSINTIAIFICEAFRKRHSIYVSAGAGTVQQAHCSHLSEIAVKLLTLYDRKMDKVREKEIIYI